MPKASRRKQSNESTMILGELDALSTTVDSLKERLSNVEKDKERLRSFNKILMEKLKDAPDNDLCLKVIFNQRKFEKQQEISMLLEGKFVTRGRTIHESFLKETREISQSGLRKRADSGIEIVEIEQKNHQDGDDAFSGKAEDAGRRRDEDMVENLNGKLNELETRDTVSSFCNKIIIQSVQRVVEEAMTNAEAEHKAEINDLKVQHENVRGHLQTKVDQHVQNETIFNERIEKLETRIGLLKSENQEMVAREFTKEVSSQAVIESLEDIIEEQRKSADYKLCLKDMQLKSVMEQNAELLQKLSIMEKRAILAEEINQEQMNVIKQRDEELSTKTEENFCLKNELARMQSKFASMDGIINSSAQQLKKMTSRVEELSMDLTEWQAKSSLLEDEYNSKISEIEKERRLLEEQCLRISRCRAEETKRHMEQILSFGADISSMQNEKEEFAAKIVALSEENAAMRQTLEEERQSKLDLVGEISQLRDSYRELREDIEVINRRRRRKWWRRLVSCS